jgi:hypothetical protein
MYIKKKYILKKNFVSDRHLIKWKKNDIICLLEQQKSSFVHLINYFLEYYKFLYEWTKFKELADKTDKTDKINKINETNNKIIKQWFKIMIKCLDEKAKLNGLKNHINMITIFVNDQILSIEKLEYKLSGKAQDILKKIFTRWLLYDQSPAPFSILSILREGRRREDDCNSNLLINDRTKLITVSEHCLAMASYWLLNPPKFLTNDELNELIVLSLFHDIFYYDDFINHDIRILELFEPYIKSDIIKKVVGKHIDLVPSNSNCTYITDTTPTTTTNNNNNYKNKLDELICEWTQMDWYFSLKTQVDTDKIKYRILPLNTFYSNIGYLMTK